MNTFFSSLFFLYSQMSVVVAKHITLKMQSEQHVSCDESLFCLRKLWRVGLWTVMPQGALLYVFITFWITWVSGTSAAKLCPVAKIHTLTHTHMQMHTHFSSPVVNLEKVMCCQSDACTALKSFNQNWIYLWFCS